MAKIIEAGDRQYELVEGWGQLPSGWQWGQVGGVAVDSSDNVHVFTRMEHPYMVFDKGGKMVDRWGEGIFEDAHGICITPDDTAYFVDRFSQIVLKFNKEGRHRLTLGTRGQHSDTGYTQETRVDVGDPNLSGGGMPAHTGVGHPGDPFHHPTDVSVAPDGSIYVSDGYRNCRVHKYDQNGTLLMSWGEVGSAEELRDTTDKPNHFHTVHSVWEHKGKVYVADRENNRIQVFDTQRQVRDHVDRLRPPDQALRRPARRRHVRGRARGPRQHRRPAGQRHRPLRQRAHARPGQLLGPARHLDGLGGLHLRG